MNTMICTSLMVVGKVPSEGVSLVDDAKASANFFPIIMDFQGFLFRNFFLWHTLAYLSNPKSKYCQKKTIPDHFGNFSSKNILATKHSQIVNLYLTFAKIKTRNRMRMILILTICGISTLKEAQYSTQLFQEGKLHTVSIT